MIIQVFKIEDFGYDTLDLAWRRGSCGAGGLEGWRGRVVFKRTLFRGNERTMKCWDIDIFRDMIYISSSSISIGMMFFLIVE